MTKLKHKNLDTSEIVGMLKPRKEPTNRHERRSAERDKNRIQNILVKVEFAFTESLFKEDSFCDYDWCFEYYADQYRHYTQWVKRYRRSEWFYVEDNYFRQLYKPANL